MKDNKEENKKDKKNPEETNQDKENNENNPNQENTNENADIGNNEENKDNQNQNEQPPEENAEKRESKTNPFNSSLKYENIYNEEKMKEIIENKNNRKDIITQIYGEVFKLKGERLKQNQIKAILNFHTQSIEFILDKFKSYPIEIITKLANIFSLLLNLKEDEYNLQLKL